MSNTAKPGSFLGALKELEISPYVNILFIGGVSRNQLLSTWISDHECRVDKNMSVISHTLKINVSAGEERLIKLNLTSFDEDADRLLVPLKHIDWAFLVVDLDGEDTERVLTQLASQLGTLQAKLCDIYQRGHFSVCGVFQKEGADLVSPTIDSVIAVATFCHGHSYDYVQCHVNNGKSLGRTMMRVITDIYNRRKEFANVSLMKLIES
jgi:hypothetical protein